MEQRWVLDPQPHPVHAQDPSVQQRAGNAVQAAETGEGAVSTATEVLWVHPWGHCAGVGDAVGSGEEE